MKVTRSTGPSAPMAGRAAASGAGFSLPAGGPAPAAAPASAAVGGVANVSALMALQGVEDATERRRRAIQRGGGLLDRLDALKVALLSGDASAGALHALAQAVREDRPADQEAGLDAVLDQIDLRAAVELAKAETARRNAA